MELFVKVIKLNLFLFFNVISSWKKQAAGS